MTGWASTFAANRGADLCVTPLASVLGTIIVKADSPFHGICVSTGLGPGQIGVPLINFWTMGSLNLFRFRPPSQLICHACPNLARSTYIHRAIPFKK